MTQGLSAEILDYSPMILQRRIEKCRELRVTVIGDMVFACQIITTSNSPQHIDWRIDDAETLPHRLVEIPDQLKNQLRNMLHNMGLNFGAFDIIQDFDDSYYFIELNPNGQYYWIEILTGAPLSDSMADLIYRLAETLPVEWSRSH
jgi:glutathione synthase/RimK-type ligase-like ATP-grasp enzyme